MTNRDTNPSQGFAATPGTLDWESEESYWRSNWSTRPYASVDRTFGYYQPAYRFGFESANTFRGRNFEDVEPELRSGWDRYEHRGTTSDEGTWENIKHAVRDAWDRVTKR